MIYVKPYVHILQHPMEFKSLAQAQLQVLISSQLDHAGACEHAEFSRAKSSDFDVI